MSAFMELLFLRLIPHVSGSGWDFQYEICPENSAGQNTSTWNPARFSTSNRRGPDRKAAFQLSRERALTYPGKAGIPLSPCGSPLRERGRGRGERVGGGTWNLAPG